MEPETISFSGGATLTPSETGKKGVYAFEGKSQPVTIQGIDGQGGATFTNERGLQFYQSGSRAVGLNPLTAPTYSPSILSPRPSTQGNPPAAQPAVGWRTGNMNRGQRPPVANEFRLGPGAGWVRKQGETPAAPQTNVIPWMARGSNTLPTDPVGVSPGLTKVLIDTIVPAGYRLRLSQFSLYLGPSIFWDDNLLWRLKVGSMDLFNPFNGKQVSRDMYAGFFVPASNDLWTGRPVRTDGLVPFAYILPDLQTIAPGTRILLTVDAVASWGGAAPAPPPTDIIAASLFGTLWGDKE